MNVLPRVCVCMCAPCVYPVPWNSEEDVRLSGT